MFRRSTENNLAAEILVFRVRKLEFVGYCSTVMLEAELSCLFRHEWLMMDRRMAGAMCMHCACVERQKNLRRQDA